MAACGTCGGSGCGDRARDAGLSGDDCCVGAIRDAGVYCDDSKAAPCLIGSGKCLVIDSEVSVMKPGWPLASLANVGALLVAKQVSALDRLV